MITERATVTALNDLYRRIDALEATVVALIGVMSQAGLVGVVLAVGEPLGAPGEPLGDPLPGL